MSKKDNLFYYLKKTYKYAKNERKYLFYFMFLCIIMCVIEILSPLIAAKSIISLTSGIWDQVFLMIIANFGIEILRNTVNFLSSKYSLKYYFAVKKNIQNDIAKETLKIETATLNQNSSGIFIERINNDTDTIADIFNLMTDYITYIITAIGIFISIFFLNKLIFLLYFIFILILFFLQKYAGKKILEKKKIEKKSSDVSSGFISELVRGVKDIKILNAEKSFLNRAEEVIDKRNEAFFDTRYTRSSFRLINGSVRDCLDFLIMVVGLYYILEGKLAVATMIVILNYRGNIMSISGEVDNFIDTIKSFTLAAERIFDVIDGVNYPKETFGTKNLKKATGEIEFKNVSFCYDNDEEVLKDISFKIKPNETVSFVGKSGSGKSTIFNLIAKLYKVDEGDILFDGISINKLSKDAIRGNLSVISQNPYIFNMSIKDNLKIIKNDLTDEEMIEACKMASLHDFIMSLKDGYDTIVGESGITLSGGQRQRLAIARALVLKTEIILFDEATSALDNETQKEIQKSIANMQGEYTILIIAHRLSTVINSDRLILIDDGQVKGMGTHEELLKTNKIYKKLYDLEIKKDNKKD